MTAIDARQDPEAAMAAAAALLDGSVSDEADPPKAPATPETVVVLPGGLYDPVNGISSTDAEVKELNGEDEEAVLRVNGDLAKTLDTILTRGTVSVGGQPAKGVLDSLLAADRASLLIGIRRATFGDEIKLVGVKCPHCGQEQSTTISCANDIPVDRLDSPADRWFTFTLPSGSEVDCSLPDGSTQREMANSKDTSPGALGTILLANCVRKIDNFPVIGTDQVRKLSWRDRDAIRNEIDKRNPGPRLGEVKRPCSACNEDIPLPLNLVDLFRL